MKLIPNILVRHWIDIEKLKIETPYESYMAIRSSIYSRLRVQLFELLYVRLCP